MNTVLKTRVYSVPALLRISGRAKINAWRSKRKPVDVALVQRWAHRWSASH